MLCWLARGSYALLCGLCYVAGRSERVGLVVADGGFAGARSRFDQEDVMIPLLYSEVSPQPMTHP